MDIFILHDGKEIGPFGEETAQTLINQGTVEADDLAWRPGMTNWITLRTLLAVHQAPGAVPGEKGIPPRQVADDLLNAIANDHYQIHVGNTELIYQLSLSSPAEAFKAMNAAE